MARLKGATQKLRDAGIEHLYISSGLYGPMVFDSQLRRQEGQVFPNWQAAVKAVIGGYRPTDLGPAADETNSGETSPKKE